MINVSALSVTIDVDMSSFVEAMESMTAMMLATAYEFEKAAENISNSFTGINKVGEENETFWGKLVKGFLTTIDIASKVKDTIDLLKWIIVGLGDALGDLSVAGAISGIAEFGAAIIAAIEPVGWIIIGAVALGTAIVGIVHACSGASDSFQDVGKDTDDLNNKFKLTALQANEVWEKLKNISSVSGFKFDGVNEALEQDYNRKNPENANNSFGDNNGVHMKFPIMLNSGNKDLEPSNTIQSNPVTQAPIDSKEQSMQTDFVNKYKDFYEFLKQLNPPGNAHVKIGASSTAVNINDSDTQNNPNTPQGSNTQSAEKIDAAAKATARLNEKTAETKELLTEVQDAAVGAFSTIG
jgi:hypothetical protein